VEEEIIERQQTMMAIVSLIIMMLIKLMTWICTVDVMASNLREHGPGKVIPFAFNLL